MTIKIYYRMNMIVRYLLCFFIILFPCVVMAQGTWALVEGGWNGDVPYSIQQTSDGGYIIGGGTKSMGAGDFDAWILKLDASGNVMWEKTIGGAYFDVAYSVRQTADGGYIVAGSTFSYGAGSSDFWVIKLDTAGAIVWQKTYGGTQYDFAHVAGELSGGGYFVAGRTWSYGAGDGDLWLLRLDSSGNIIRQKTYGGSAQDTAYSVKLTSDGGYIVGGGTWSFGSGNGDFWIMKLDSSGNILWQKAYGGSGFDYIYSIIETGTGYIAAGWTFSFGAGNADAWIINVDGTGNIIWEKTYGGSAFDYFDSIVPTSDGGYVAAGRTESFGAGGGDFWIVKLDSSGTVTWQKAYGGSLADSASAVQQTSDGGYIVAGSTQSFGMGVNDYLILKLDANGAMDSSCTFVADTMVTPANSSSTVVTSGAISLSSNASAVNSAVSAINSSGMYSIICPPTPVLSSLKPSIDDSGSSTLNGIIEPDENIVLKGLLKNSGTSPALSVTAVLSTADPVTITNANATYPDLAIGSFGDCITCYGVIAPAANRTLTHWDFAVTESPTCTGCPPLAYNFLYHVGNSFSDVPAAHLFYSYIEKILHAKVTSGCTSTAYCPAALVQRQQIAKFICKSMETSNSGTCSTTACSGIFLDVPSNNLFCTYIEALYRTGIVSGCQSSPLLYCPNGITQRQAMAKFICLAMNSVTPNSCATSPCAGIFSDVNSSNPFCSYIEGLFNASIISGCTPDAYCPANDVSREQMAKFLVNAFNFAL